MSDVTVTVFHSFHVTPPTEIVCTNGEWTVSNDDLRIAAAGNTCGEAMNGYLKAWSEVMQERVARAVLDVMAPR